MATAACAAVSGAAILAPSFGPSLVGKCGDGGDAARQERFNLQAGLRALYAGRKAGEAPKPWWEWAREWMKNQGDKVADAVAGLRDALKVRHLKFSRLEDGHISVSADTPPGTRLNYRQTVAEVMNSDPEKFFGGTRYNPKTIAARTSGGLLRSSFSKGNLAVAGVVSLAQNLWQFGPNPAEGKTFWDRTVKNREFWVSTAVDFAVSVTVGVAAAAGVAGAIAGLVALGFTVAASTPLWLTVGATTGLGIYFGSRVEAWGVPETLKNAINSSLEKIGERR